MNNKKLKSYMKIANTVSENSTCIRKSVGCVIVNYDGWVLNTGYNGVPSKIGHCIESNCPNAYDKKHGGNNCLAVHAEQNALMQCTNVQNIYLMFCTLSPCLTCAKMICNTSCKKFYYAEEYPDLSGINLMKKCGIEVIKLEI